MGDILINGDVLIAVCVLAGLVLLGGLVAAGMLAMKLVRRRRQSPTPSSLSLATVTATGGSYSKLETVKVGGSDGDDKVANDVIQKVGKDSSKISFVNPSLPTQLPLGSINSASAGSPNYGTANATRKQIPNTSIPPPPASPRKITGLSDDEEETLLSPINNHINSSINNHSSVAAAAAPAWSAEAPPFTVLLAHTPVKRDDLALAVGDQVRVSMCFSDGFVHGVNMTTGKVGVFPLSCVKSPARRNSLSSSSLARTSHEQQHQQKLHSAPANMMDDDIVYNGTGGDLDHHHSGIVWQFYIPSTILFSHIISSLFLY